MFILSNAYRYTVNRYLRHSFKTWTNWGLEKLSDLPRNAKLDNYKAGTWTQIPLAPKPTMFVLAPPSHDGSIGSYLKFHIGKHRDFHTPKLTYYLYSSRFFFLIFISLPCSSFNQMTHEVVQKSIKLNPHYLESIYSLLSWDSCWCKHYDEVAHL